MPESRAYYIKRFIQGGDLPVRPDVRVIIHSRRILGVTPED